MFSIVYIWEKKELGPLHRVLRPPRTLHFVFAIASQSLAADFSNLAYVLRQSTENRSIECGDIQVNLRWRYYTSVAYNRTNQTQIFEK